MPVLPLGRELDQLARGPQPIDVLLLQAEVAGDRRSRSDPLSSVCSSRTSSSVAFSGSETSSSDRHPVADVADERAILAGAERLQDVAGPVDQIRGVHVLGAGQLDGRHRDLRARLRDHPQVGLRRQRHLARGDRRVATLRQRQQPQPPADVRGRLADLLGQRLLRTQTLELGQPLQRVRLLDRVQVLALDVRDQRRRQPVLVLSDQHRHLLDAGDLRRAQPPLAVDQPVVAVIAGDGQCRGDPVLLDRRGELRKRRLVETVAGVEVLRHLDLGDLDGARLGVV